MATASCRRDGCDKPRRVRRGQVEPLCEDCYRRACQRVAEQLAAEESAAAGRERFRSSGSAPAKLARIRTAGRARRRPQRSMSGHPTRGGAAGRAGRG